VGTSEHAALWQAIRAAPDDSDLRLVYADWLEENGDEVDAAQAEFIRLQHQTAALPDRYDVTAEPLVARERDLFHLHRASWGGAAVALEKERSDVDLTWGDGMVEEVALPLELLLKRGEGLRRDAPAWHRGVVSEVRGNGARLAGCPWLAGMRELTLVGWPSPADATALVRSPHLRGLRRLRVWLGGRHDREVVRMLAAGAARMGLQELRLLQLLGGHDAEDEAEELDSRADELAVLAGDTAGRALAVIERPWAAGFPLREYVGYSMLAGHLAGGNLALVVYGSTVLLNTFDPVGQLLDVQEISIDTELMPVADLRELLASEFGFRPGLIRVQGFATEEGLSVHLWSSSHVEFLHDPENPPSWFGQDYQLALRSWLAGGNFVINWYNDYYAGPYGQIHSS
jgi:uncharacterized protein (TIGR02996 family)